MKKFTSKIIALFIAALMICSVLPMGVSAIDMGGDQLPVYEVSKSKTATNLDENFESQVTLSLPSAEVPLVTDVVFVLDESSCSDYVKAQVGKMLEVLYEHISKTNAKIKIGAVQFRGCVEEYELTELTDETKDSLTAFMSKRPEVGGSNMSAGLIAGKAMLDADDTVSNDRKYLILVSDGITYIWDDENTTEQENYGVNFANTDTPYIPMLAGPDGWDVKHGKKFVPSDWSKHFDEELINKTINEKSSIYIRFVDITDKPFIAGTEAEINSYTSTVDIALYKSYQIYQSIISEYSHSYVVIAGEKDDMDTFPFGPSFMEFLAGGNAVSFDEIENDIIYLVDKGSIVRDRMGSGVDNYGNEYDFDFVNDIEKISITVGGVELDKTELGKHPSYNYIYQYGFGYVEETATSGTFRYLVAYDSANDEIYWRISEPVTNFTPVQLTYTVKLTNPQTTPGTYGMYDADGSEGYSGLYTNEFAFIQAQDSAGTVYAPDYFDMPTVSYTVAGEEPEEPEEPEFPIINPTVPATIVKVDADNPTVKLSGAVFAIYSKQGISERLIGKYETDEDGEIKLKNLTPGAYYAVELEAPEGYVLDDSKQAFTVKMGSSNIITIGNTAVTVPPVFNEDDHFAYIVGYPDETVRPENNITRAEVITIFFRLLSDETRDAMMCWDNDYVDVNEDDWFNCAVSTLTGMGIVNGYTDDTFRPNEYITRAEFAAIAARFELNGVNLAESFDDAYGHWAEDEIKTAKANGWILGYEDGTFKPDQLITRAEAMTIVNRVLCRIPYSPEHLHDDMIVWSDNMDEDAWYYLAVQEATNSHYYVINYDDKETWTEIREPRDWTELEKVH